VVVAVVEVVVIVVIVAVAAVAVVAVVAVMVAACQVKSGRPSWAYCTSPGIKGPTRYGVVAAA